MNAIVKISIAVKPLVVMTPHHTTGYWYLNSNIHVKISKNKEWRGEKNPERRKKEKRR